jgi:hypothetical protein
MVDLREHPTGGAHLDHLGIAAQLLARCPGALGRPVGQVINAYRTSALMGLLTRDGACLINPPSNTLVGAGDKLILVAGGGVVSQGRLEVVDGPGEGAAGPVEESCSSHRGVALPGSGRARFGQDGHRGFSMGDRLGPGVDLGSLVGGAQAGLGGAGGLD